MTIYLDLDIFIQFYIDLVFILYILHFSIFQHVFLERELLVHQGCVRHQSQQDDRVDGPRRDGHTEGDDDNNYADDDDDDDD